MLLSSGLCSVAAEVAVLRHLQGLPKKKGGRHKAGWLLSILPHGIKMNVEAVSPNRSLNSVI